MDGKCRMEVEVELKDEVGVAMPTQTRLSIVTDTFTICVDVTIEVIREYGHTAVTFHIAGTLNIHLHTYIHTLSPSPSPTLSP